MGSTSPAAKDIKDSKVTAETLNNDNSDSEAEVSSAEKEEESEDEKEDKKRKVEDDGSDSDKPSKKSKSDDEKEPEAEPSTVFVGSLSWGVDDDSLRSAFEHIGTVTGARVVTHSDSGRSKGYGYVDFASPADAKKAVEEMHQTELDGRNINVDLSHPKPPRDNTRNDRSKQYGESNPESNTLFVANLSFNTTRDDLFDTFGEYGTVQSVRIPTNPDTGKPRGFGYVEMESVDVAKTAFQALNGQEIAGRNIRLDYTSTRDGNSSGGRGGFNGGRGGRGGFGGRGGRGGFNGGRGGRGGFGGRGGRGGFGGRGGRDSYQGRKTTF